MELEKRTEIERVLQKLKLRKRSDPPIEPFYVMESAIEEATSFFFFLPRSGVILVKCAAPAKMRDLWRIIDSMREDDSSKYLFPVAGNGPPDNMVVYNDGAGLKDLFQRLRIPTDEMSLHPRRVFSGLAGFSRLYHIQLAVPGSEFTQNFLVKFDRPDRLRREWASINQFRRQNNIRVPSIQFPYFENSPTDGLIVYELFHAATPALKIIDFAGFAISNLPAHTDRVIHALILIHESLDRLYLTASRRRANQMRWHDLDEEKDLRSGLKIRIVERISTAFPSLAPDSATFIPTTLPYVRPLGNPLFEIDDELGRDTEALVVGATHGDLQSTNILIGMDGVGEAIDHGIIDLEKFSFTRPLLSDLVRIEADFFRSIVTKLPVFLEEPSEKRQLLLTEAIIATLDQLEGREMRLYPLGSGVLNLVSALGPVVQEMRRYAARKLSPEYSADPQLTRDYFIALKQFYLRTIQRSFVYRSPLTVQIVFVCASLAHETAYSSKYRGSVSRWTPPQIPLENASVSSLRAAEESVFAMGIEMAPYIRLGGGVVELRRPSTVLGETYLSWVNPQQDELVARINISAYRGQQWVGRGGKGVLKQKMLRNRAHLDRHSQAICLMSAFPFGNVKKPTEEWIGFSHVLPLNEAGYRDYVAGKIQDNHFPPGAICSPPDVPVALLVFSVGLYRDRMKDVYGEETLKPQFDITAKTNLLITLCEHIYSILELHQLQKIKLMIQNDNDTDFVAGLSRLGFLYSDVVSGDGHKLRSVLCSRA